MGTHLNFIQGAIANRTTVVTALGNGTFDASVYFIFHDALPPCFGVSKIFKILKIRCGSVPLIESNILSIGSS